MWINKDEFYKNAEWSTCSFTEMSETFYCTKTAFTFDHVQYILLKILR